LVVLRYLLNPMDLDPAKILLSYPLHSALEILLHALLLADVS